MEVQNTLFEISRPMLIAIGLTTTFALISLIIQALICNVREFISNVRLKYKQKHRFDKSPTAKCYCIDCVYHDHKTGRCQKLRTCNTADDWFCWNAEPRKTEEKND